MRFSQIFGRQDTSGQNTNEANEKTAKALWEIYAGFRSAGFDGDQAMYLLCTMIHTQLSK